MKLFISSDVHSFYTLWMNTLKEKGFDINDPTHCIVVLGDLLDRGQEPEQCLDFVNSLPDSRKILILGNHEELMLKLIDRGYPMKYDIHNGTVSTVRLLTDGVSCDAKMMENNPKWVKYINSCVDYWENKKHVFVHGWIPKVRSYYGPGWTWRDCDWSDARWDNGMFEWTLGRTVPGKTVWCGHWHTSWGHAHLHGVGVEFIEIEDFEDKEKGIYMECSPFKDKGIVAMDACTALSNQVNVEVIEVDEKDIEKGKHKVS